MQARPPESQRGAVHVVAQVLPRVTQLVTSTHVPAALKPLVMVLTAVAARGVDHCDAILSTPGLPLVLLSILDTPYPAGIFILVLEETFVL